MLRVAILSTWHVHATEYATEISSRSDAVITVVWDEDPIRGMEFAKKFNADFEADYQSVLEREDVDAVAVTSPTNMHKCLLVAAANAKKHIFTEKVLATTNVEALEIRDAVEKNGVKFCISFPHRTIPQNLFAKKLVDEGVIGDVTLLRVRNVHNGSLKNWLPPHFYDKEQCGGGAMIDLGAHPMYLARWILGKPVEISSIFTNYTDKPVEDNAVSVLKYENGAIAISETGFVSEACPFSMEIYGTEGVIMVGGYDGKVKVTSNKIDSVYKGWIFPNELPERLPSAISQWVDSISTGSEIIFGMDDAVALTELMDAAYRSHREGKLAKV